MPAHRKYFDLPDVKTCPVCRVDFPRPENYGHDRWFKAKVCSLTCAARLGKAARLAKRGTVESLFWDRVDTTEGQGPNGECHHWTGSLDMYGYGRMKRDGKATKATHLALQFAGRPLPAGMMACHRCDNPPCVREDHLFHGTGLQNHQDRAAKKRGPREESHHKAKLTAEQVIAIRADTRPYATIADSFGVSKPNIAAIRGRKTWKDI